MNKILSILSKLFVNKDGNIALKRILATLIILGYLAVSIYNGEFENPVGIITILLTGV